MTSNHEQTQQPAPDAEALIRPATPTELSIMANATRHQRMTAMEKAKREAAERRIRTDSMTGLLSREGMFEQLDRNCRINPDGLRHVTFIDGNGVKIANEILGYNFGDSYIVALAKGTKNATRIGRKTGNQDYAGRYGGDEFVVFGEVDVAGSTLQDADVSSVVSRRAEALKQSVRESMQQLIQTRLESPEPIEDVIGKDGEVKYTREKIISTLKSMLEDDYEFIAVGTAIYSGDDHDTHIRAAGRKMSQGKRIDTDDERTSIIRDR